MKIRFIDSVAGARFAYRCGQEVDLPPEIAQDFLRAKQAVVVRDAPPETETLAAPETTARRVRAARREERLI